MAQPTGALPLAASPAPSPKPDGGRNMSDLKSRKPFSPHPAENPPRLIPLANFIRNKRPLPRFALQMDFDSIINREDFADCHV